MLTYIGNRLINTQSRYMDTSNVTVSRYVDVVSGIKHQLPKIINWFPMPINKQRCTNDLNFKSLSRYGINIFH